ncbi:15889_t:CDS:2, partial [Entrophospora sp. SA101]
LTSTKKSVTNYYGNKDNVTNYYGNKDNVSVNPGMSKSEIENLIKSMIPSSEPQQVQVPKKTPPTVPPKDMEAIYDSLLFKELYDLGFRDGPIVDFIESYNKRGEYFKRKQAQKDDSDEELSNRMSKLSINKAISKGVAQGVKTGIRASNKSSRHRCSNCNRTGHNSRNCSRKKKNKSKRKANVNIAHINSRQNSGTITVKPNRIDKSLQNIILDMFDGILPVDLMDKLKMKIENSSNIIIHNFTKRDEESSASKAQKN